MKNFQSPTFYRFVMKIEKKFKAKIDKQIENIQNDPEIGERKKGDLQKVQVHKFKFSNYLYLIAYRVVDKELELVMISTHEKFYRDLKKYIKK